MNRTWCTSLVGGAVVTLAVLALTGGLRAQNAAPLPPARVASIDIVKVFNEYQRQKDLTEEMKQVQDKLELENQQRRQKIDAAQATVDAMNAQDPARAGKMRELLAMQVDYKNWFDLNQAAMGREVGVWSATIYREITKAAEQIAVDKGYDIVIYRDEFQPTSMDPNEVRDQIRNRKLIYANPRIDIGQPVLDKLNAEYRTQPRTKMISIP